MSDEVVGRVREALEKIRPMYDGSPFAAYYATSRGKEYLGDRARCATIADLRTLLAALTTARAERDAALRHDCAELAMEAVGCKLCQEADALRCEHIEATLRERLAGEVGALRKGEHSSACQLSRVRPRTRTCYCGTNAHNRAIDRAVAVIRGEA